MNTSQDLDYYVKRQQEEQELARRATDPCVRRVHEDMARKYAERARATQMSPAASATPMSSIAA